MGVVPARARRIIPIRPDTPAARGFRCWLQYALLRKQIATESSYCGAGTERERMRLVSALFHPEAQCMRPSHQQALRIFTQARHDMSEWFPA